MSLHNEKILWASHEKSRELYCMQAAVNEGAYTNAMYYQLRFLQAHDEHAALLHGKRGAMQSLLNFLLDAHGLKHK